MFTLIKILPVLLLLFANHCFAAAPERIVSLAPSVTKCLYMLGAEDNVIAVTVYCPQGKNRKESIGTVLEPNIEKIISLSPSLVIASKEGNQRATVERLEKMGIKVYTMDSCNSFDDICAGFLSLGKLIGKESEARDIIERSRKRVLSVRAKVKGRAPVPVFWEVGAQPLFTVSKKTFVNDFIELAGGQNIFRGLTVRYPQISREEVVRRDPAVIFLVTMGDVTAAEKRSWLNFKEMSAVKNDRVYILNDSLFTDPTPPALAEGVEKIAEILWH